MDEFDVVHLGYEDSQEIIDWAVCTGAAALMIHEMTEMHYEDEADRLIDIKESIEMMLGSMPVCMINPVKDTAWQAIKEVEEDEQIVEEFVQQLNELDE